MTNSPIYVATDPLEKAILENNIPLVRQHLQSKAQDKFTSSVIASAISNGRPSMFDVLLNAGFDINEPLDSSGSSLLWAASLGNRELTAFLLSRGADPNRHFRNHTYSPLATAAHDLRLTDMMLAHNATVKGSGALIVAAEEGNVDVVRLLLEAGADVSEIGVQNWADPRLDVDMGTALHKAVVNRKVKVVRVLLDAGADVNQTNMGGETAIQRAEEMGDGKFLRMLEGEREGEPLP